MALPPGVKEVNRIAAPNGGFWILGSDGGVFTEGGAAFFGSYPGLDPSGRQGDRMGWSRIEPTGEGGYTLVSGKGERYTFNPPTPAAPVAPPTVPTPTVQADPAGPQPGQDDVSGRAVVADTLKRFGLDPSLGDKMLTDYLTGGDQYALIELRNTEQYKKRFAALDARRNAGYSPINEAQYIEWETNARSLFDHYGIPKDFYDQPEELAQFIAGDVSVPELKNRVEQGYMAAMSTDPATKQALQEMYGIDDAHLATFFLDPTKGEEIIKKRWTAAQIGGSALETQFGGLSQAEAERLAGQGLTGDQARQGFGTLEQERQLFGAIPGETEGEGISREEQLGAITGDVSAQEKIKRKAQQRTAGFQGGGGYASGQQGVSGLGES